MLTVKGVILTSTLLTLLVLAESIFPPWAPYFILYGILALVIPIVQKTYKFGSFKNVMMASWLLIVIVVVADLIVDPGIMGYLYGKFLAGFGQANNPFYSVDAASNALFSKIMKTMNISYSTAQILFSFFIMLWAPFGEEFFYRGYVFGTLRLSQSFWKATLISSAFFGIRHATHFFYLIPDVPYVAALCWAVSAFPAGLLLAYLYEKSGSLYTCITAHLLINFFWIFSVI